MSRIVILCRCQSVRKVLFAVGPAGQLLLPEMLINGSESRLFAFDRFIAEHFGTSSAIFNPQTRTLGLKDADPIQVVTASVGQIVNPLYGAGDFCWVGRFECQQSGRFTPETLLVLHNPGVLELLFGLPQSA